MVPAAVDRHCGNLGAMQMQLCEIGVEIGVPITPAELDLCDRSPATVLRVREMVKGSNFWCRKSMLPDLIRRRRWWRSCWRVWTKISTFLTSTACSSLPPSNLNRASQGVIKRRRFERSPGTELPLICLSGRYSKVHGSLHQPELVGGHDDDVVLALSDPPDERAAVRPDLHREKYVRVFQPLKSTAGGDD